MKILIVEDNQIIVKMLGAMLTKIDCAFDTASSGTQAIEFYLANFYDAIFMDIGLPDINGINTTKLIRQHKIVNKYIPIIGLTAHSDPEYKEAALQAGMDQIIIKPLEYQDIYELINKLKTGFYDKANIIS